MGAKKYSAIHIFHSKPHRPRNSKRGTGLRASSHGKNRCPERLGFLLISSDSAGETAVIILWEVQIGKTSAPPATQDNVNIQQNVHVPASVCVCLSVCAILQKEWLVVGGVVLAGWRGLLG